MFAFYIRNFCFLPMASFVFGAQVYSHRVGKAVEYMITDVLLLADPFLGISTSVDDPRVISLRADSFVL